MTKYVTENLTDLLDSYQGFHQTLAYKDLLFFLDEERKKAMEKLKKGEDHEARATWQVIDRFEKRFDALKSEEKIQSQINKEERNNG